MYNIEMRLQIRSWNFIPRWIARFHGKMGILRLKYLVKEQRSEICLAQEPYLRCKSYQNKSRNQHGKNRHWYWKIYCCFCTERRTTKETSVGHRNWHQQIKMAQGMGQHFLMVRKIGGKHFASRDVSFMIGLNMKTPTWPLIGLPVGLLRRFACWLSVNTSTILNAATTTATFLYRVEKWWWGARQCTEPTWETVTMAWVSKGRQLHKILQQATVGEMAGRDSSARWQMEMVMGDGTGRQKWETEMGESGMRRQG